MAHGEAFRDVEFEQSKDDYSGNWVAWARISGKPVLDDEGGPIAYRGAILDITEQKRGEQALRDSQVRAARAHSQLVDAIESISDGFALYDADDRLVLSNTTYRELLPVVKTAQPGRSFGELLRAGVTSGNLPEGIGDEEAWVQNRLAQHRHPSDPTVQEYSNGLCLRIAERRTQDAGTVVVLTDITELIHGERELAEKPKLLHATLHNMSQGLAVFDRDLRLLAWNNRMLELLDLAPDLVHPGRSFAGIMDAIATDGCGDALAAIEHAVMRTRGAPTHEIKRSNGTVIEMHTGPMPDGGTVATYTDITPAKKREATLRRQALIFDRMFDGVVVANLEGEVLDWSRGAEKLFGYSREEVIGRPLHMLRSEEKGESWILEMERPLTEVGDWSEEMSFTSKDGSEGICEMHVSPLFDDNGHITAWVGVNRDITDRKQ